MKRLISFLLAIVLVAGLVLTGAPVVYAASAMRVSDEMVAVLKQEEGFAKYPYADYGQWTVGYGTVCPDDMVDYYKENGISEEAAETLLRNYLSNTENTINKKFIDKYNLTLTQGQFDALVSFTYNCGTSWIYETTGTFHNAIKNGTTGSELIRAFSLWCSAGGQILPGLVRRRLSEANMYLNQQYSRNKPDHFCYVYYSANGGSVSYRIQGYDATLGTAPAYTAYRDGATFLGWYTAQVGGSKVDVLTQDMSGITLYAHWDVEEEDVNGTPNPGNISVEVVVTGDYVNLRKGPGTNYGIVDQVNAGHKLTITETAEGSGYRWGNAGGKWICLTYTNYDEVLAELEKENQEATKPTEPEATEPDATEPEATEPEATESEATEPEATEPEATEPSVPEATTVSGTVRANGGLALRTGPGTGYSVIRFLENGSRVTILEQRVVGSMTWGKISEGWISMSYVVLDEPDPEPSVPEPSVPEATEPEATEPEVTEPEVTEPEVTEPEVTEPEVTEPEVTEPEATEPEETEPEPTVPETTPAPAITGKVKAVGGLAVRNGAGTNYSVRKYIANGSSVTVTEQVSVNGLTWGKVGDGWICMNYVVVNGGKTEVNKTVVADCLRVRSAPGTDNLVVGFVYHGASVTVFETTYVGSTPWGKIASGWVSMDYLK